MNFRSQVNVIPLDISKVIRLVVPRVVAAVTEGCAAVVAEAQIIVPVDTGDLQNSIHTASVSVVGTVVEGVVTADSGHAAYVEFGTGIRGAESEGAGAGPYSPTWPGMPAQPYMRPSVDTARAAITEAYANQGFKI